MIELTDAKAEFQASLIREVGVRGFGLEEAELDKTATVKYVEGEEQIQTGHVLLRRLPHVQIHPIRMSFWRQDYWQNAVEKVWQFLRRSRRHWHQAQK